MNDVALIEQRFGSLARFANAPPFWLGRPQEGMPFLAGLAEGRVEEIGVSAGGRPIVAVSYGERECIEASTDNYSSALHDGRPTRDPAGLMREAFFGSTPRKHPVVVLQGAIHGAEITGTVASLNLCNIIENGVDLRGRAWPLLRELALETRLLIIPWLNPDGAERNPIANPEGTPDALHNCVGQGVNRDGTSYGYPEAKSHFPIPVERAAFLGCYYNDAGVNLQYDFTSVERQPETLAWMRAYLAERPDGVLNLHCNAGSLVVSGGITDGHKAEVSRIAGIIRQRLHREGRLPRNMGRLTWEGHETPWSLDQSRAIFHVSGATPICIELPCGMARWPATCDEMLDIGLICIEECLYYAHHDGLRPYEFRDKSRHRAGGTRPVADDHKEDL